MNSKIISKGIIALGLSVILFSCVKKEFDIPPVNIPKVDFSATMTIAELKSSFSGTLDSLADTVVIQGIVTSNDEEGNFYKKLIIQDETAGIEIAIDKSSLYNMYRPGQRIFVKCGGLYLGDYAGTKQVGYIYNGDVGRIPDAYIEDHLFLDSLPGKMPAPKVLSISSITNNDISRLVEFDDIELTQAGQVYAVSTSSATDRTIKDQNGDTIVLRTSSYASFASSIIPAGKGSIVGVLGKFNDIWQLYIRSLDDVFGFDTTATDTNTVELIYETFNTQPSNWTIYSASSNRNWSWSNDLYMWIDGAQSDAASDDWLISPAINFSGLSEQTISFRAFTKYSDSQIQNPLTVQISTDYTGSGDPSVATWTTLNCTLPSVNSQSWTESGNIDLSAYTGTVYVGFQYKSTFSTTTDASRWQVDTFKATGKNN